MAGSSKGKIRRGSVSMSRGQAALFDGIMFLLFASFSVAMIYVFLNEYGKAQDATLRSGYVLAYVQQAGKLLFFAHAKAIKDVANAGVFPNSVGKEVCWRDPEWPDDRLGPCNPANPQPARGRPYSDLAGPQGCSSLGAFELSTVADLLKKDLGDGKAESYTCFDDQFGNPNENDEPDNTAFCVQHGVGDNVDWSSVPRVPGKTALRCVMKEVMKPLQTAGFKYFVDFQREVAVGSTIPQQRFEWPSPATGSFRITNHWDANEGNWVSCENVTSKSLGGGAIDNVLTTSIPFRVNKGNLLNETMNFVMRVCIWPTKKSYR